MTPLDVVASSRYTRLMTQTNSTSTKRAEALQNLSERDRVWLQEREVEYRQLLDYLHDN